MVEWSGESFASTRTVLPKDSRFVRQTTADRLQRADGSRDNARAIGERAGAVYDGALAGSRDSAAKVSSR